MNTNSHNAMNSDSGHDSGEDTLRLIAGLPAPVGLEERVHKALRAAPHKSRGGGRVLAWPARLRAKSVMESNWMRAAAAATIVFVVVGGGWGVYSRVLPGPAGKVIVMPQIVPSSGGFSGAGAIRVPETLPGPTVTHPAKKADAPKKAAPSQHAKGQHPASAATPQRAVSQ